MSVNREQQRAEEGTLVQPEIQHQEAQLSESETKMQEPVRDSNRE